MMKNQKKNRVKLLERESVQALLASLICILLGLIVGYIVLLCINPEEAWTAMTTILKNFFYFPRSDVALEYFGSTLVKTAPLLMCTISVIFAYKAGLFNIGASGQFAVGAGCALYLGLQFGAPWWICVIAATLGGALIGAITGVLKAYRQINEVIVCIMLNWISLYAVNMLLTNVKKSGDTLTLALETNAPSALLPALGLDQLFSGNAYVTIAIPLAILLAVLVWFVLKKTLLGYELKATGFSPDAAKYAGMREKKNIIITMAIAGALAGLGAAFLYLSGIEQWNCSQTAVPAIGFNGIAAAFLGGLHPIGAIFSAFFIQHISIGGSYINPQIFSVEISDLISAVIIYFCAFAMFIKYLLQKGVLSCRKKQEGEQKSHDCAD